MTTLETTLARIDQLATDAPDLLAFPSIPRDRLRAILFGLAIGDALGNTTESWRPRVRVRDHGEIAGYLPNRHADGRRVGLPSDDTQMAFWLLEQLLDTGRLNPDVLAQTFAKRDIYGIGQSVRAFRTNLNRGIPWDRAGSNSAGNGAIMRVAPMLVLQPTRSGPDLARDIATCAAVTHNEPGAIAPARSPGSASWRCCRPEPEGQTGQTSSSGSWKRTRHSRGRPATAPAAAEWQAGSRERSLISCARPSRMGWTAAYPCWNSGI